MRWIFILAILAVAGFAAYVRLAPTPVDRMHVTADARAPGDTAEAGSFQAVRAMTTQPEGLLRAVETIAGNTPRTRLIAGSATAGLMTFETRSRWWGFPDYTTVSIIQNDSAVPLVSIYARLRFGKADLGVNKARVENWLSQLGPLVVDP